MKTRRNIALVVAAGTGNRFGGDLPKQFVDLDGKQVVLHCLELFERCDLIDEIVFVVPEDFLVYASRDIVDKSGLKKIHKITVGGESRQESVHAGLSACHPGGDLVIIHDAVRPLLRMTYLRETIEKAVETGAAVMAVPSKESVKLVDGETIVKTLIRDTVWIAQTPQVFKYDRILDAHRRAEAAGNEATDDAELYEQYYGSVVVVRGSYDNIKITTAGDLVLAREIMRGFE